MQLKKDMVSDGLGKHGQVTVYRVKRAIIPEHTRTGYKAVRVNVKKTN